MESATLDHEKLGDIDTFLHGYAVARNCQVLDNMAAQLNLRELSDFGFNDDFRGERPTWHPPEAGLPTITGLRQSISRKGAGEENSLDKLEEVIADLERIDTALCKARDKNVPFCFILRNAFYQQAGARTEVGLLFLMDSAPLGFLHRFRNVRGQQTEMRLFQYSGCQNIHPAPLYR